MDHRRDLSLRNSHSLVIKSLEKHLSAQNLTANSVPPAEKEAVNSRGSTKPLPPPLPVARTSFPGVPIQKEPLIKQQSDPMISEKPLLPLPALKANHPSLIIAPIPSFKRSSSDPAFITATHKVKENQEEVASEASHLKKVGDAEYDPYAGSSIRPAISIQVAKPKPLPHSLNKTELAKYLLTARNGKKCAKEFFEMLRKIQLKNDQLEVSSKTRSQSEFLSKLIEIFYLPTRQQKVFFLELSKFCINLSDYKYLQTFIDSQFENLVGSNIKQAGLQVLLEGIKMTIEFPHLEPPLNPGESPQNRWTLPANVGFFESTAQENIESLAAGPDTISAKQSMSELSINKK